MNRVLVSWLGIEKDFTPDGGVNMSGPTVNFYKHYYEHDFHVLLVTEENVQKALLFKKTIEEKFKNIFIILKPQNVEGVHWNLKQLKYIGEQVLMELKDYQIDIFFSTGSAVMKIAWFILHYTLGLNTRLLQIVRPEESHSRTKPDLYILDFETSQVPLAALIRQHALQRDYQADLILTPTLEKVYDRAYQIAQASDAHLFITGDQGTGKETLARYIHKSSVRESKPFNVIDCAAYPEQELEFRLMGFKRGSFPGAAYDSRGLLVETNGGTLYLKNFDALSYRMQNVLRRFMEDGFVHPLVGRDKKVNVRLLFGTSRAVKDLLKEKIIMPELYYYVGLNIHLPSFELLPVDEKKQIINEFNARKRKLYHRKQALEFCQALWNFFISYSFPGNFTELQTILDTLYIFGQEEEVCTDLLPDYISVEPELPSLSLADVEKIHIEKVLRMFQGNKSRTARALGVALNTLKKKINDYGIDMEAILRNK